MADLHLEVRNLVKSFGGVHATKNVNLEIDTAQVPPTNRTSKSPF